MQDNAEKLGRIEQLLQEGNDLRRQALAAQRESIDLQKSFVGEQRENILKAGQVTASALLLQKRAHTMLMALVPVIVLLIGYVCWLLFTTVWE